MTKLLKEKVALAGSSSSREQASAFAAGPFDGKWFFGDQVLNIIGRGTDLTVGVATWHFKQLSDNTCELLIFDELGAMVHVVTGRLSANNQTLTWNSGRVWERGDLPSEPAEDSGLRHSRKDNDLLVEQIQLLRRENQRLREAAHA